MAVRTATSTSWPSPGRAGGGPPGRLGIDQPAGWWPTTPRLKSYEAAGFHHVQVRMPPRALLAEHRWLDAHAGALRESLRLTGLGLILHAPDDLHAGSREGDTQLDGALRYAALAGSDLLVYHGSTVLTEVTGRRARRSGEERSLHRVCHRADDLGVRIAIENLAPVYPERERFSPGLAAVAELVRRLECEQIGMCLDLGHAHIAAGIAGCQLRELVEPLLARVILFHVHDNFGARWDAPRAGGIEPVRLDLHLAPGAGSVPWATLAPLLAVHPAPLQLEVHPFQRPEPATLAIVMRELLGLGAAHTSRYFGA
jgi:sugar phosphate isomerase/epimerase